MNAAYGTFQNEIFILKPREEGREDSADVVNGDFAGFVFLLEDCQISPQVICGVVLDSLGHVPEQLLDSGLVVLNGFSRTAFNKLCRKEYLQQTIIGDNVLLDFAAFIDERVAGQRLQ